MTCIDCGGQMALGRRKYCSILCKDRAWRRANQEKIAVKNRKWRKEHLAEDTSYNGKWQRENPDKVAKKTRKWSRANPNKVAAYKQARRARKLGAFVEHVDRQVLLIRDHAICGICGDPVDPLDFHVDHIQPLSKGGKHSYANTQVSHPKCNLRKSDKDSLGINPQRKRKVR